MGKNVFHNDSLQLFSEKLYDDMITIEHKVSMKTAIMLEKNKYYGYFFEKRGQLFFLQDYANSEKTILDELPIQIIDKVETDYNKKVFWYIRKYCSRKIPNEKRMQFRELIDTISGFSHSEPIHFTLYKIVTLTGYVDRINYRAIADRGFGKDCVVNNIRDLVGSIANIYGATMAKLEYSLKHKQLIFNEMGNLKAEEKYSMQQFLLAIGAFFNTYTKRSRATEDTQEEYNISKTSLGIIYNPPIYYVEKGQQYFDQMFTRAVNNRFIPFLFKGVLTESFDSEYDVRKVVEENDKVYKDVISTIFYYRSNTPKNKYVMPDDIEFDESVKRYERTFLKICDYISEYAKDEKEFYDLVYELYECYKNYDKATKEADRFIGKKNV